MQQQQQQLIIATTHSYIARFRFSLCARTNWCKSRDHGALASLDVIFYKLFITFPASHEALKREKEKKHKKRTEEIK